MDGSSLELQGFNQTNERQKFVLQILKKQICLVENLENAASSSPAISIHRRKTFRVIVS